MTDTELECGDAVSCAVGLEIGPPFNVQAHHDIPVVEVNCRKRVWSNRICMSVDAVYICQHFNLNRTVSYFMVEICFFDMIIKYISDKKRKER